VDKQHTAETLRTRLLEVIGRTGLSRSAFARKVGLDRSTLSQLLAPSAVRLPRVETLAAIAVSEQVRVDWLIGLTEQGEKGTDILEQSLEVEPSGHSPSDACLARWRSEALGYKIRHVPATLPDLMKTDAVLDYEYRSRAVVDVDQRRAHTQGSLEYQRRPETDTEVCTPRQSMVALARGEGLWEDLSREQRRDQLDHMIRLSRELYPTFRWFLYDARAVFSAPLTIFGPRRAVLYVGQRYFVFNSVAHIRILTGHFDGLIRMAAVQASSIWDWLAELRDTV